MAGSRKSVGPNLLVAADSERDADMLYASGIFVPDPFLYLRLNGRCFLALSDLEIDRARKRAKHCRILSLSQYQQRLRDEGVKSPGFAHVIRAILREHHIKKIFVPASFSHGLAKQLRDLKVKIKLAKGAIFPERETKTPEEIKKISAALMMAEVGLAEGIQVLKSSKLGRKGQLMFHHVPLTSEKLQAVIETAIIQAGGLANHTIVACGKQGCDPHERGHGPLRANQPIIIDIFPRSKKTGYFGDITRTVVRGKASESIRRLYHTVQRGQEVAFQQLHAGRSCLDIHKSVADFFESAGYKTGKQNGRMAGFFHSTGHGVGLDLHEAPRIGLNSKDRLKIGNVVTVEPGLYYPELGGVRLEDIALIRPGAPRNLTKFEKVLEL